MHCADAVAMACLPCSGNLAAVQLELGEVQASLGTFQRALEIEPNFPDALSNMGNALKILGKLPEVRHLIGTAPTQSTTRPNTTCDALGVILLSSLLVII